MNVPPPGAAVLSVRFEWDDPVHVDELLEIEIPLAEERVCRCVARVARVDPIVWKEPTRYEVFLDLLALDTEDRVHVTALMEPVSDAPATPAAPTNYVVRGPIGEGSSFNRPRRTGAAKAAS